MGEYLETEWKYTVPTGETAARLREAGRLGPFALGEYETRPVEDAYYDAAGLLLAAGYACRYRQTETGGGIELKSLAPADGHLHRRSELHAATDQPTHPSAWPDGPARQLALAVVGEQALQRLFTIRQTRRMAPLLAEGAVIAQVSLDEVEWLVGQARETGWEFEIELSESADLSALDRLLVEEWGLRPESSSKFERGLRLAQAGEQATPAAPDDGPPPPQVTPKGIRFALDEPATALLQHIIAVQADRLHEQYHGVIAGEDVEAVHDARVAARRMRSALSAFEPWLPQKIDDELRRQLRGLGRTLGPVRDLDVSLIYVHRHAEEVAPAAEAPLRRHLEKERDQARKTMLAYYKGKDYKRLQTTLHQFARRKLRSKVRLGHILPELMRTAIAEIRLYEGTLQADTPDEHFHALRIAIKRLRYLLEFTRYVTDPDSAPLIDFVISLQDQLGDAHDAYVSCNLAFSLLRDPGAALADEERAGLLAYGLALGRNSHDLNAGFTDPLSPTPLWPRWEDEPTQAELERVVGMLTL
ncbi:MAG: CHAD domain-containing protein [Caldilineales bacterium]|nr:CHAD domain-containing protein [Caldilineales bacterium]MCW5856904.1 CHAD domain-containing protein [Caldilineales bacterium]